MVAQHIAFGILAAAMVVAAWKVVTTQNVVRAVLFLVIVLAGAAAQYLLLAAEFIGVVQIIVYIGAIVVLFLFGTMLTRAPIGAEASLDNDRRWTAGLVSLFLVGVVVAILLGGFGRQQIHPGGVQRAAQVSDAIFGPYVIPFEVASVLLLAALVGAVAIARRD